MSEENEEKEETEEEKWLFPTYQEWLQITPPESLKDYGVVKYPGVTEKYWSDKSAHWHMEAKAVAAFGSDDWVEQEKKKLQAQVEADAAKSAIMEPKAAKLTLDKIAELLNIKLTTGETVNHQDPIQGYQHEMSNTETQSSAASVHSVPCNHQTLVVIHSCSSSRENFRERVARLVGGFNTENTIKADVVTISDGKIFPGVCFTGSEPGGIDKFENQEAYNLIIVVKDAKI